MPIDKSLLSPNALFTLERIEKNFFSCCMDEGSAAFVKHFLHHINRHQSGDMHLLRTFCDKRIRMAEKEEKVDLVKEVLEVKEILFDELAYHLVTLALTEMALEVLSPAIAKRILEEKIFTSFLETERKIKQREAKEARVREILTQVLGNKEAVDGAEITFIELDSAPEQGEEKSPSPPPPGKAH